MILAPLCTRTLPDGRRLDLLPLFYGVRLCLAAPGVDDLYDDVW